MKAPSRNAAGRQGKGRSRAAQALRGIRRHRRRSPSAAGTGAPPFLRAEVLFHTEAAAPLPSFSRIARLPATSALSCRGLFFTPRPCSACAARLLSETPFLSFLRRLCSSRTKRRLPGPRQAQLPYAPCRPCLPHLSLPACAGPSGPAAEVPLRKNLFLPSRLLPAG